MKVGALVGGATVNDANLLYEFAMLLGTSFQIKDDYLDVYGDPEKFGKQVGGDIISNKKTLLWIEAEKRSEMEGVDFASFARMTTEVQKVKAFQELYSTLRVDQYAKEQMAHYYELSLLALSKVDLPSDQLEPLREFAAWLYTRES